MEQTKFYCVVERYFKNYETPMQVNHFVTKCVTAPNHIVKEYDNYTEHIYTYKKREDCEKHYKLLRVCLDMAESM